jgi:hypothetical protein
MVEIEAAARGGQEEVQERENESGGRDWWLR